MSQYPAIHVLYWLVRITLLASVVPLASPMQISDVNILLCARLCQCTAKTVDCNHQDGLSFIPSKINQEYNQLHISHANFQDRSLRKDNFSTIIHLTSLKIVYSKLESLRDNTFQLMDRLQYVDLSHNNFSSIEPRAFYGLRLINLYLERNHVGLQITPTMFTGLKVTNLYLRSNGIDKISVIPFEQMELGKLYLFNNSITAVDKKFENLFSSSNNLLDLTKNPLDCSCALSWFADLITQWRNVPEFVQITCQTPGYLLGRHVSKLSKEEFPCEIPNISQITVDVSSHFLHLICHAKGNSAAPKISWTQINSETGSEMPHYEEMVTVNHLTYVSINVSKLRKENSFICRTWNEVSSSNQVLVKVKLVENFFEKLQTPTHTDEPGNSQLPRNQDNHPPETHFLFTKQFSILQMIGAVVGTFTGVIVLIFIICCSQEHLLKKNATSNPYWTIIPTENKPPTNRFITKSPISPTMAMVSSSNSQDYDVPQYHESNNFLQNYFTERNPPHYVEGRPTNYFSTVT